MSNKQAAMPRILHLHSTFNAGGKELRCAQLINAFGPKIEHTIVSAEPEELLAAHHIYKNIPTRYPRKLPPLKGRPTLGRLQRLAKAMSDFDLVLTYNWGAMDAVMAHTVFNRAMDLPNLIHHEDGFNEDERTRRKWTRNLYRRIALGKASGLVVPSETLEGIALTEWAQPLGRVKHIPNAIPTRKFTKEPKPDALRGVIKRDGELWVGTLAGMRAVKNLPRLVRVFSVLGDPWQLVIVGDGPEREAIEAEADRLDIAHRVHLPGFVADPANFVGLFDIFALTSDSEQFPIAMLEAMAAAVPVCAPAVGDIANMVSEENLNFIAPAGHEEGLMASLSGLARHADLRASIGVANRQKARAQYDEKDMIATYRRLYSSAMGREI